jgi:hypothetical protein
VVVVVDVDSVVGSAAVARISAAPALAFLAVDTPAYAVPEWRPRALWVTEGRPDALKMFSTTGEHLQGMSPQDRVKYGRAAFGTQGFGAVAVASDPQVQEKIRKLDQLRSSPEFLDSYQAGSTMQDARTVVAQFNVTMGELARMTLPSVNVALGGFKSMLEGIRGILPAGVDGKGGATIGGHAILGAAGGALVGSVVPGVGTLGGAVIGGVLGTAEGFMEGYVKAQGEKKDNKTTGEFIEDLKRGTALAPAGPQLKTMLAPISLSLNIDGQTLARVMSSIAANSFSGQAPAFDGLDSFVGGDHQHTDK